MEPTVNWLPILGGYVGVAALGLAAWRGWLTRSGIAAAFVTGAALIVGSHAAGPILLALFLVSSSALDRVGRRSVATGGRANGFEQPRHAGQVLANAVVPAVAALLARAELLPEAGSAMAGALAAMTADTWATEVGAGMRAPARLITTWRAVPPGESGGLSLPGTLAGVGGALTIGLVAALLPAVAWGPATPALFAPVAVGGIVGLFVDSLLGATAERRLSVVTNETVNLLASLTGAFIAFALATWAG